MRKLHYNIYSNISDEGYFDIEDKMAILELTYCEILEPRGWKLTETVKKSDALIIDLTTQDETFYGNIGLTFTDKPNKQTFTFYITKGFDEGNARHFVRKDIISEREIEYFENNINGDVELALKLYNDWNKKDIVDSEIDNQST